MPSLNAGRLAMKFWRGLFLIMMVALASAAMLAQTKISIPAGTPEDKALNAISSENDAQKKIPMLEEFVQTYSGNPAAVAYGNWQLAQHFAATDPVKAISYNDKALATMPDVLDILQSQVELAQHVKDSAKVVDYAARGAKVINGMEGRDKEAAQSVYEYLDASAYNAVVGESDAKKRLAEIETYSAAFAGSPNAKQANVVAVAALTEMNDLPKLADFGEKALAADPNNVGLLTLMANAYVEDAKPTYLAKATTYAHKAIELSKSDESPNAKITEGFAHEILGYSLLREEKTPQAIAELKTAATMLKSDPTKYSLTLYRLGYAYAKSKQMAQAKEVLTEASGIPGPFQQASKELLAKVGKPVAAK
jgi:tetratricopeptide (TPR) repeat protein